MPPFKKYKLGELGEVITGKTPASKFPQHFGNYIPFITPSDFGTYIKSAESAERYISKEGVEAHKNKILPENSVLVTCIGSDMGKVVINKKPCLTNQQINSIIPNKELIDYNFLYYSIINQYDLLRSIASDGTTMPIINKTDFEEIEIEAPDDLPTQTRIANILSSLDDKIELNRRTNHTLEQIAQTLFKKYFVDDIDPENLPEGWRVASLNEFMDFEGGMQPPANQFISNSEEGYIRLIQIRDYESDSNITYVPIKNNLRFCNKKDVMIARYGASVARICFGLDGAYNVALVKVKPHKPFYTEFLRTYLKSKDCQEKIINMSFRSVQAGFNKDDFKSIMIPVPNQDDIFIGYEKEVSIMIDKILQNREENKILAKNRDSLLPKLMSGEIEVNAAEKELVN